MRSRLLRASLLTAIFIIVLFQYFECQAQADHLLPSDECENLELEAVDVEDGGIKKEIFLLMGALAGSGDTDLSAILKYGGECRIVLSVYGRGIVASTYAGDSPFPDLYSYHSLGIDELTGALMTAEVAYHWNGTRYVHEGYEEGMELNKKALGLLRSRKIEDAIKVWKRALELVAEPSGSDYWQNAEIENNLGYAYYLLWKETRIEEYYWLAEKYLESAYFTDQDRCIVNLNQGDLYYESGDYENAISSYKHFLKCNPDHKYANKIKQRLDGILTNYNEMGKEHIISRYPSGKKRYAITKYDESFHMQVYYLENGHSEKVSFYDIETLIKE